MWSRHVRCGHKRESQRFRPSKPTIMNVSGNARPGPQKSMGKDNAASAREPLFGFLPRKVKGDQVRRALVRCLICRGYPFTLIFLQEHDINPFTKLPHTE